MFKIVRAIIGYPIGMIGAKLWTVGGFNTCDDYKDLKLIGKIGYQLFCTGVRIMGEWDRVTSEDFNLNI